MDLETTGLNPIDSKILLCQISTPDNNFVIDVSRVSLEPLLPYLRSYKWVKIIQNAKFEQKFFQHFYKVVINNVWDTYLAEILLSPDSHYTSLGLLSKKYLDRFLEKETRDTFAGMTNPTFTEEQLVYAAADVDVLLGIKAAQEVRMKEQDLGRVSALEFELAGIVASMELTGVPIDLGIWKSKIHKFEELHEQSRLRMHELLFDGGKLDEQIGAFERDSINLNSPKQLKEAFHKLGIKITSTSEREIALLNQPVAKELMEYRGLQKILSAYGSSFLDKIHPFTGRIHADFQQIGTETGRFSCKEPNLQQMPAEFRECVSDPKWMIVGADYSQIELRILAELSGDPSFIKAFVAGEDLHRSTASRMFGISMDNVTKEQRFIAKTINFGISYGMGVGKLMDMLNAEAFKNGTPKLKFMEVKHMLDQYHAAYRKVGQWLAEAGNAAFRQQYSETMYGRKRYFTRPSQNEMSEKEYDNEVASLKRKGANSPIQGTNADITKLAMVAVYNELKDAGYKSDMIIQVHDEIVVLARKDQAESVKEVVEGAMIRAASEIITKVPIKVESYISDAWKK